MNQRTKDKKRRRRRRGRTTATTTTTIQGAQIRFPWDSRRNSKTQCLPAEKFKSELSVVAEEEKEKHSPRCLPKW